jgi:hypothetical protein
MPTPQGAPNLFWQVEWKSGGLSGGGGSLFNSAIETDESFMDEVMKCLAAHKNVRKKSGFGDQYTCWNGAQTKTVDYQGTREGSRNSFWTDLQGQWGREGMGRSSYFGILVEVCDDLPPREDVEAAIKKSLKDQERAVFYKTEARPK